MGVFKTPRKIVVRLDGIDAGKTIKRAKKLAAEEGMTITGNNRSGTITGPDVDGDYEVTDSKVVITLREAPMAPWIIIKTQIKSFIRGK